MNIQSSEYILLTGAGFTKNFGTPLAREMWSIIFNHKNVQAHANIKELMLNDFDYESIYNIIMTQKTLEPFNEEAFNDAIKFAYDFIDEVLRKYNINHPYPEEVKNVNNLIYRFGMTTEKSFIFTLNQDLFFERLYSNQSLSIPGIKNNSKWFTSYFNEPFSPDDYITLPDKNELSSNTGILSDGNFFLIKLHGSYNWKSFDGSQKMVIGGGKVNQIREEPLLKYYCEIFKKILSQDQRRLLIIGYGFGDHHINKIISDSVRYHGLKIYIISPESPEDFKNKIKNGSTPDLWQGISGYFPHSLKDLFPLNLTETQMKKNLFELFFGEV